MPEMMWCSGGELVKMLSMRVLDVCAMRVGLLINGNKENENMVSMNCEVSKCDIDD